MREDGLVLAYIISRMMPPVVLFAIVWYVTDGDIGNIFLRLLG